MRRKDFQLIASLIAREIAIAKEPGFAVEVREKTLQGFARLLATEFTSTNARFDRQRFLTACNVR